MRSSYISGSSEIAIWSMLPGDLSDFTFCFTFGGVSGIFVSIDFSKSLWGTVFGHNLRLCWVGVWAEFANIRLPRGDVPLSFCEANPPETAFILQPQPAPSAKGCPLNYSGAAESIILICRKARNSVTKSMACRDRSACGKVCVRAPFGCPVFNPGHCAECFLLVGAQRCSVDRTR